MQQQLQHRAFLYRCCSRGSVNTTEKNQHVRMKAEVTLAPKANLVVYMDLKLKKSFPAGRREVGSSIASLGLDPPHIGTAHTLST